MVCFRKLRSLRELSATQSSTRNVRKHNRFEEESELINLKGKIVKTGSGVSIKYDPITMS